MISPTLRLLEFKESWKKHELVDIAKIQRGRFSPRPRNNPIYYGGEFPFVQTSDVVNAKGYIKNYTQSLNEMGLKVSKLFPPGTILITIAANIGYTALLEIPMACPDSLVGITCDSKTYNIFLKYQLEKEQPKMDYLAVEAAQKNINIAFLEVYPITMPPRLEEQKKIADFLTSVDTRIQQLSKKRILLERWKKGLMQQLFSQSLRFKDDNGNDFPDWKKERLDQLGVIVTGKTPSTSDKAAWEGDTMFVTPSDINDRTKYQYKTTRYVNGELVRVVRKNSLMFTCIASIGKMSIAYEPCITNQQINSISVKSSYSYEYVYYALRQLTPKIKSTQANNTLPIINKTEFSKFVLPVPRMEEQVKIANCLSAIDKKIESVTIQIEKTKTFKKGLLQQMFV